MCYKFSISKSQKVKKSNEQENIVSWDESQVNTMEFGFYFTKKLN